MYTFDSNNNSKQVWFYIYSYIIKFIIPNYTLIVKTIWGIIYFQTLNTIEQKQDRTSSLNIILTTTLKQDLE